MWFVRARVPSASDEYVRSLMRIWRLWETDVRWSYYRFTRRQAKFVSRLRALSPPPEYASDHESLAGLLDEQQSLLTKRTRAPRGTQVARECRGGAGCAADPGDAPQSARIRSEPRDILRSPLTDGPRDVARLGLRRDDEG
jgi:hypothetical protein